MPLPPTTLARASSLPQVKTHSTPLPSLEEAKRDVAEGRNNPITRFIMMYSPVMVSLQPAFLDALDAAISYAVERGGMM